MEETKEEKWNKAYKEYEETEKKYKEYTSQFFTKTINGEITQEAKEFLTKEKIEMIKELREERYKKAKEFWDLTCSIVFPNQS